MIPGFDGASLSSEKDALWARFLHGAASSKLLTVDFDIDEIWAIQKESGFDEPGEPDAATPLRAGSRFERPPSDGKRFNDAPGRSGCPSVVLIGQIDVEPRAPLITPCPNVQARHWGWSICTSRTQKSDYHKLCAQRDARVVTGSAELGLGQDQAAASTRVAGLASLSAGQTL